MTLDELSDWLQAKKDAEEAAGAEMFMGIPERWLEAGKFRCTNGHVSTMILRCSSGHRDRCLECGAPVRSTFPEDVEMGE